MNERIKELAIEAEMIVGEANGFDMTRLMPREVKFAELIVRECADIADDYDGVGSTIVSRIKKHFGVE
jgi:hypothetical protein